MSKEEFLNYVSQVNWRFCKSMPNWPHFYIVEKELPNQVVYQAARAFVKDSGKVGKFFDMDVHYFDVNGWTYWASPLAKKTEDQYMLNRCKTEYSYDSLAKSGSLPPEGFREKELSLTPILEDDEFKSLIRDAEDREFTVFDALGNTDYEIRHSNVLSWLLNQRGNHRQESSFLNLLWKSIAVDEADRPTLSFQDYSVTREGVGEDEKIDILIKAKGESPEWVIVVENKIFSPEGRNQLHKYYDYIERKYAKATHRRYFYLTPGGKPPVKEDDCKAWKSISYSSVIEAVRLFLKKPIKSMSGRVKDFLVQYVEHIEKNVLKSEGTIDRQRNILRRHAKIFHSLAELQKMESNYIREQCQIGEIERNLLESILAVQTDVSRELFECTKRLMKDRGYPLRGLGYWKTIQLPSLREKLIQSGLAKQKEDMPIVFALDSRPDSYVVEVWLYTKFQLYKKVKSQIPSLIVSDDRLAAVLYRKTIINADQIIKESLPDLKKRIADYFEKELKTDLEREAARIGNALESIVQRHEH